MAEKSQYQDFQSSWTKTLNWARTQGISTNAVLPVYEMDSKRLLSPGSYTMSEGERIRAILASSNPNNVTPLPTDQPEGGIGGFFNNVMHDATNIFTGLQPTHLVNSIYHSALNTFEHPAWILNPEKNTLAQLIPGYSLVGEFEQGGLKNVFAHPLITAINVLGIASAGTSIIGHTLAGDAIAEAIGVQGGRAAIGGRSGLGPIGIASKAVGNIGTGPTGFSKDATGTLQFGHLTVGQRLANWTRTKGAGGELADINAKFHALNQTGQATFAIAMKDVADANEELGDLQVPITDQHLADLYNANVGDTLSASKAAWNLVTMSGKPWAELASNSSIPVAIKTLLSKYQTAIEKLEQAAVAKKELVTIKLPDGTMGAYIPTEAKVILSARQKWEDQEERANQAGEAADKIAVQIQHNDAAVQPALSALATVGGKIQAVVKRPLSQELRTTLVATTKADRDWHDIGLNQQTVSSLLSVPKATITQGRIFQGIFGDGGLIDQVAAAYQKEDFVEFRTLTQKLHKSFHSASFKRLLEDPTKVPVSVGRTPRGEMLLGNPTFNKMREVSDDLYRYAKERAKAERSFRDRLTPKVQAAQLRSEKLLKDYENVVWKHPAAVWQPLYVRLMNQKISQDEKGALAVDTALSAVARSGKADAETLAQIRRDPARVIELLRTYIGASHTAPFGTDLTSDVIFQMQHDTLDEIARLRAEGFEPHYVPNFDSRDKMGAYEPGEASYIISINPTHYLTPDAAHERLMDMSNTIYDIHAGLNLGMKQRITSDATQEAIDEFLIPRFGYKQSEMMPMIEAENPLLGLGDAASAQAHLAHYLEDTLELGRFDPSSYGLVASRHITGADTIWMPKMLLKGLDDTLGRTRGLKGFDPTGVFPKATEVFRESVLGYSPRFLAHISFGGAFLMAGREPLSFAYLGKAAKMLQDPQFRAAVHTRSTQIGADNPMAWAVYEFHREGGRTMGRLRAQEMMDQLGLDPSKMSSWLKVIPQLMFKLTNYITDMQRSAVVLAGIGRAERHGMTDARALEEGVKAANKVFGDLSHSTPLERNMLMTVMPFYGWTKHILQYVATYPVDHPYRAVFLAYLANMNSDEVSKGLYTRIQNLFFLGQPDAEGNVNALDVRFLNPLRDVANYATLGGLISSLNPVFSAPFAAVDPEVIFGNNVLYPNISYNSLYGVREASPAGGPWAAVEQFVPEVTALQAAIGQSSQYRNLAKSNPNAFAKVIFGALNIPFAQVQHLNLKQIAATQELDRYNVASAAATSAFQSGDFAALQGYGEVPNPLQGDYNISPAQLQAIYDATLKEAGGLPPSEVLPPLPAPAGL
jgi:hypothetical protein